MDAKDLLSGSAPRLWTIPAGVPFIDALAGGLGLASDLATQPAALQDALIYVPNRRSARTLALSQLKVAGDGAALLPPDIRALGDLEGDEAPHGAEDALAGLGPPLSDAKRTGTLMRMVRAFYEQTGETIPLPGALAAAEALGALLDQAAIAGLEDWSALSTLVSDTALAHHWERSAQFLTIITEQWPGWLAEQGALDPLTRRTRAAEALAAHWATTPPPGPLIIAGSTGSTPASLILMKAALQLPQGRVILPGLDTGASPEDWAAIAEAANHHQAALSATLGALGTSAGDVPVWPVTAGDQPARRQIMQEALAPAALTGDWRDRIEALASGNSPSAAVTAALEGFSLLEADDEAHEAQLAALMMRHDLEHPGQHTALVTPDEGLKRRVSALLARWDVAVTASAGTPLMRTETGLMLGQVLSWWRAPEDPVAIAALLNIPALDPPGEAQAFERDVLRGPRRWRDLDGLVGRSHGAGPDHGALADWLASAMVSVGDSALRSGMDWASALAELVDTLGLGEALWRGTAGQAAANLVDEAATLLEAFPDHDLDTFLQILLARAGGVVVPPSAPSHPNLSIWGPLEARLQTADHLILAGLNEDVWPQRPGADPFLPAHFKQVLGLPDPEERMGLMAHDFAGLACAPRVTCLYAARRGDAPAVASRWIWRLKTLVAGAGATAALEPPADRDPRPWAGQVWQVPERFQTPAGVAMPRPTPPVDARPKRLSVTRIDWLQRDPYAIYAQSVLGLISLDPLDAPVGPKERGTAIHAALEAVGKGDIPEDADALADAIETELANAGMSPADLAASRAVTRRTADWCLNWLETRKGGLGTVHVETSGALEMTIAGTPFTLSAKADRIEDRSGGLAILDFKTGQPPSDKQIETGLAQQMPLQALIAREGAFDGIAPSAVSELTYVAFKARPDAITVKGDPAELAAAAEAGLVRLVSAYRQRDQAFLSAPRVQFVGYDYGYNRLARRAEWTAETSDE